MVAMRMRWWFWRLSFAFAVLSAHGLHGGEPGFSIEQSSKKLTVSVGDHLFTELDIANYARPILYPVHGPGQTG